MGLRALAMALYFHDGAEADVGIGEEHVERVSRIHIFRSNLAWAKTTCVALRAAPHETSLFWRSASSLSLSSSGYDFGVL